MLTSPGSLESPDPTTLRSPSSDRTPCPIPTMGTVKELAEALTNKLKDIGRHSTIPLPQFGGKKGEDANGHCMKVEDYFSIFKLNQMMIKRFLETLFVKARRWVSTINIDGLDGYKYEDKYTKEQKKSPSNGNFSRDLPRKEGLLMQLSKLGGIYNLILPRMMWKNS